MILQRMVLLFLCLIGLSACAPEVNINNQMIAAARIGDLEKVQYLAGKVDDINAREEVVGNGHTALFNAASAGHTEIVKFLIKKGAKSNEQPGEATPLIMAAWAGHADTVLVIITSGQQSKCQG
ncbi:MAG: ankyrin repeat domain-containing protein [Thiobacillus sp.]|nr:ankyrin repeat domain-containing protein [Thiobacillus sp.]